MRSFIRRHPLISFFTLAYIIIWIGWLLFRLFPTGNVNGFEIIAALGPALAAMMVSGTVKPDTTPGLSPRRQWLFLLTLAVVMAVIVAMRSWVMTSLVAQPGRMPAAAIYPSLLAVFVDLLGASAVALVISGVYSSRQGVRELLITLNLTHAKTVWRWLVFAVAIYPLVVLAGNTLSVLLGTSLPAAPATGLWYWVVCDAILMGVYGLLFGGGFEEPGWRGFALPVLHRRFSPLVSCLILGPLWAFWHWPLFWTGDFGGGVFQVIFYALATTQYSVLLTALYKWSKRSLPVVMLFHSTINITSMYLPVSTISNLLWLFLSLILAVWLWRRPDKFVSLIPS